MNTPDVAKTILCIDDDQAMHVLLKTQLESSGFASMHAMSGDEALRLLRDRRADLVILDINMPRMDGFQFLRRLKTDEQTQDIPVIFLSSLSRENLKVKGLEHGADDFIVKPFTGPELIARIKAVLRRHAPARRPAGDVVGKLSDLGMFELLHMLSFSGRDATVAFPDMEGELAVAGGTILAARQGRSTGRDALVRLFLGERGSFAITYTTPPEGEPLGTIESLLLFVGSTLDEIRDQMDRLVPADTKLVPGTGLEEYLDLEKLRSLFPVSLQELILALPGPLADNLHQVEQAVLSGAVVCKGSD